MALTNAPFIRALLRTVPRRDLDDLARAHLGLERPHTVKRPDLVAKMEAENSPELAEALGAFICSQLTAEARPTNS